MIYTDGTHLIDDGDIEELHDFAINKLGFKRAWFQDSSPPQHPHYDLTTSKAKKRAVSEGAILINDVSKFVQIMYSRPKYKEWMEERKNKV